MLGLRNFLPSIVIAALVFLPSCAGNDDVPPTDGGEGMDGSQTTDPDGSVTLNDGGPPGTSRPCGGATEDCCVGRVCELGLTCGRGDRCFIEPGSGVECTGASSCERGLACEPIEGVGRCCAPRRAACEGSSDCCTGLVCGTEGASEGVCAAPAEVDPTGGPTGTDPCGDSGQRCCAGFTCIGEKVCTDGTCQGCGGEDDRCCDGTSPCTSPSLSCDVTTGACINVDPATACGEIDNPCCDATGHPGGTDCSGDLICRSGTCLRDTDVGFDGAACTTRGGCDATLICDRTSETDGTCTMTPSDCGRDTQGCCDLGAPTGTCEGSLHCQFGECSTCRGPSLSCVLGLLLPSQQCCAGSVCRPAPLLPRCCMGDGGACENSTDCCGLTDCGSGGTCACSGDSSFCLMDSECCDGMTCSLFQCTADAGMCEDVGATCESSGECCGSFACSETRSEPTAPPVRQCCAGGATACESEEDCCGRMACEEGECQCVPGGGLCDRDIECCETDSGDDQICVAGACASGLDCARETRACSDDGLSEPLCCGGLRCDLPRPGVERPRQCCASLDNRCRNDTDCCGHSTCGESETCECVPEGSACETGLECCEGFSCAESSVGAADYQCRSVAD